jgi:hypothetical protein
LSLFGRRYAESWRIHCGIIGLAAEISNGFYFGVEAQIMKKTILISAIAGLSTAIPAAEWKGKSPTGKRSNLPSCVTRWTA